MHKTIHPSCDPTILDLPLRTILETCNKAMNATPNISDYLPPMFTIFCDGSGPKLVFHTQNSLNVSEKVVHLLKTDFGSNLIDRLKVAAEK
jgi:hypothetical protein